MPNCLVNRIHFEPKSERLKENEYKIKTTCARAFTPMFWVEKHLCLSRRIILDWASSKTQLAKCFRLVWVRLLYYIRYVYECDHRCIRAYVCLFFAKLPFVCRFYHTHVFGFMCSTCAKCFLVLLFLFRMLFIILRSYICVKCTCFRSLYSFFLLASHCFPYTIQSFILYSSDYFCIKTWSSCIFNFGM